MEIEYSQEVKGKVYAYRFEAWEMAAIAAGLVREVDKRMKRIERIKNHPKNEGQVTFQLQVEVIEDEIAKLNDIIEEFTNG